MQQVDPKPRKAYEHRKCRRQQIKQQRLDNIRFERHGKQRCCNDFGRQRNGKMQRKLCAENRTRGNRQHLELVKSLSLKGN